MTPIFPFILFLDKNIIFTENFIIKSVSKIPKISYYRTELLFFEVEGIGKDSIPSIVEWDLVDDVTTFSYFKGRLLFFPI